MGIGLSRRLFRLDKGLPLCGTYAPDAGPCIRGKTPSQPFDQFSESAAPRILSKGIFIKIFTGIEAGHPVSSRFAMIDKLICIGTVSLRPQVVAADIDQCQDGCGVFLHKLIGYRVVLFSKCPGSIDIVVFYAGFKIIGNNTLCRIQARKRNPADFVTFKNIFTAPVDGDLKRLQGIRILPRFCRPCDCVCAPVIPLSGFR